MKIVKEKSGKDNEKKSNALLVIEDARTNEICKGFFPKRIVKNGKDWICPICLRPHHKKPGPFTRGVRILTDENAVTLWVQSFGCCRWQQQFPFNEIKERKVKKSDLNSVLLWSFSQ